MKKCTSLLRCPICDGKHHALLHVDGSWKSVNFKSDPTRLVVLATAMVPVLNQDGYVVWLRALLDNGSECSVMSEIGFLKSHGVRKPCEISISTLGQKKAKKVSEYTSIPIWLEKTGELISVDAVLLPDITGFLPSKPIDTSCLTDLNDIELADSNWHSPGKVDLLLGADVFFSIVQPGQVKSLTGCTAMKTKLGWAVSGHILQPARKEMRDHARP
jgi:hypothetical protein